MNAITKAQQEDVEDRLPLENYLDFISFKKIVEKDWDIFKENFNIPEKGEKGKHKNLKWMDRINKLRRIPSHKNSEERQYEKKDLEYIDWIFEEFTKINK